MLQPTITAPRAVLGCEPMWETARTVPVPDGELHRHDERRIHQCEGRDTCEACSQARAREAHLNARRRVRTPAEERLLGNPTGSLFCKAKRQCKAMKGKVLLMNPRRKSNRRGRRETDTSRGPAPRRRERKKPGARRRTGDEGRAGVDELRALDAGPLVRLAYPEELDAHRSGARHRQTDNPHRAHRQTLRGCGGPPKPRCGRTGRSGVSAGRRSLKPYPPRVPTHNQGGDSALDPWFATLSPPRPPPFA